MHMMFNLSVKMSNSMQGLLYIKICFELVMDMLNIVTEVLRVGHLSYKGFDI
jgi:hypothetical protein